VRSITLEEVLSGLAAQIGPQARAKIDIGFEGAAEKYRQACAQWRDDFAADQAKIGLSITEQLRAASQSRDERTDILLNCALHAWFPVHQALCDLGDAEYGRHEIRTLSRQALESIVRIVDRAYDSDLYYERTPFPESLSRKPLLIDRNGVLPSWVMERVERHPEWIAGSEAWRAMAERHAVAPAQAQPSQELEKPAPIDPFAEVNRQLQIRFERQEKEAADKHQIWMETMRQRVQPSKPPAQAMPDKLADPPSLQTERTVKPAAVPPAPASVEIPATDRSAEPDADAIEPRSPLYGPRTADEEKAERRRLTDEYKAECKQRDIRRTYEDIARDVNKRWGSRTQIEKWLACKYSGQYGATVDRQIRDYLKREIAQFKTTPPNKPQV
jgi:hypothetical protein